jgi:hypothetical protein
MRSNRGSACSGIASQNSAAPSSAMAASIRKAALYPAHMPSVLAGISATARPSQEGETGIEPGSNAASTSPVPEFRQEDISVGCDAAPVHQADTRRPRQLVRLVPVILACPRRWPCHPNRSCWCGTGMTHASDTLSEVGHGPAAGAQTPRCAGHTVESIMAPPDRGGRPPVWLPRGRLGQRASAGSARVAAGPFARDQVSCR